MAAENTAGRVEIATQLAYREDNVSPMNDGVRQQQNQIDQLKITGNG